MPLHSSALGQAVNTGRFLITPQYRSIPKAPKGTYTYKLPYARKLHVNKSTRYLPRFRFGNLELEVFGKDLQAELRSYLVHDMRFPSAIFPFKTKFHISLATDPEFSLQSIENIV